MPSTADRPTGTGATPTVPAPMGLALTVVILSALALVWLSAAPALARTIIEWTDIEPTEGRVLGGAVVDGQLVVEGPGTHHLLTLVEPAIEGDRYALVGTVDLIDVEGSAYLEMWSQLPDGGRYFSRTLAVSGPMASLSGSATGRPVEVPFLLNGSSAPTQIELNLVLPGSGTVRLDPLALVDDGDEPSSWWSVSTSAVIGGVGGSVVGLTGAAIGLLSRRRGTRGQTVERILIGGAALGLGLLVVAVVALVGGQPRHVWYPFGLLGVILVGVEGLLLPRIRRANREAELRRMEALDA